MTRASEPPSPSGSGWDTVDEDDTDDFGSASIFPVMQNRLLTTELLGNTLRAMDLRVALEALAKYTNDPNLEFINPELYPPGWDDAKEFIQVVLQSAVDKFFRLDAFLRAHQDFPEQLFACMYYLCYACNGLAAIIAESSHVFLDLHDPDLCLLLSATCTILDGRAAVYTLPSVRELPNLTVLRERTETYLNAQPPPQLSSGESDDEVAVAGDGVIHLRTVENGNIWQAYLVQLLAGMGFVENLIKIVSVPKHHTLQLHSSCLSTICLMATLLRAVVHQPLNAERRQGIERGVTELLSWVAEDLMADPEKLLNGRDRSAQFLSHTLANCHDLVDEIELPSAQLTVLQRQVVTEMLKSSNFSRLLSAVQECRALLNTSLRRSRQGPPNPDFVGIEDNVQWLDQERIVRQMLRVNLHQSQYAEAVLGILRVLAECGHLNDEHLDMLWSATEQEDTFDAVKTNVCHMIKQLAAHLRPQQLDLLFTKFENRKGRTLTDTLRLLDLLKRLAQSDTKKASSMAGKLVELVWDLTTPADAPPELLNSSVMLDVLEGYRQHALLSEYIQRCIAQLRARTNVYTALTVLQNLLRLWGKLYGWEARGSASREERRAGGPLPDLLASLDAEGREATTAAAASTSGVGGGRGPPHPPLSRILVDNLSDFMAAAARWLEERRGPPTTAPLPAPLGEAAAAAAAPVVVVQVTTQPPGQGSYSYQQIVRRYLDVFRLVSQCKDTYANPRLVEALWDTVVLRPNTPEDMPSGLDLIIACAGEVDEEAQAAAGAAEALQTPPGPLLELRDLVKLLTERVTRLPVEGLGQPAFACFKACYGAAKKGLEDHLRMLPSDPSRCAEMGEREARRLQAVVWAQGREYLWRIVLDCQRSDVTAFASEMLINEVYRQGVQDMVADTRTHLMASAAVLTSAPLDTVEWEHVPLPADVMESPGWEAAKTRTTRCLQLLEQLAGRGGEQAGGEDPMPPVPAHSASWLGPTLMLEVSTPDLGRIKVGCAANEYVGLLRRKVAIKIGAEPACVRLVVGGHELRADSRTLLSALPPTWSARQTLLAQVSPCANQYTRFGEEWWGKWHSEGTLAHMYHDDQLYRVLLLLADLPGAPGVRAAAIRLLQQLPTCRWVPASLLRALLSDQPAAQLRRLLLLGPGATVERPGLLLYTLQALYALLQPSYPPDLLPLVYKPWPPSPSPQPQADPSASGPGSAPAARPQAPDPPHQAPHPQPQQQHQPHQPHQPPQPHPQQVAAGQAWWQVVASGGAADRLLPVLAQCVPLLAEVVDKVMEPVTEAAAAAAATSAEVAGRAAAGTQPAADLAFVKDFQWVMVFLLCNIHNRARKGPSGDGHSLGQGPGHRHGHGQAGFASAAAAAGAAAAAAAAGAAARPHPADSLSSSHGHEPHEAGPGGPANCPAGSGGGGGSLGTPRPEVSGGQESEVGMTTAGTAAAAAAGPKVGYGGGGGGGAATPEVTSGEAPEASTSMQLGTQDGAGGGGEGLIRACGSGPAAAAAALVSGLVVSSRGSPEAACGPGGGGGDLGGGAGAGGGESTRMDVKTPSRAQDPYGMAAGAGAAGAEPAPLIAPATGSSTDVEMVPAAEVASQQAPLAAAAAPPGNPSGGGGHSGPASSISMGPAATASAAGCGGHCLSVAMPSPPPRPLLPPQPLLSASAPPGVNGGCGAAATAAVGNAFLLQYLGHDGLRCMVSLLVRMSHEAGCLWGYGNLLTAQQAAASASRLPGACGGGAAAAGVPSYSQMSTAAEVACRLISKALQVLGRLVQWPELRVAFLEDKRTVPMLLETLSCEFSTGIRDVALGHLEGVFANPQLPLPPLQYSAVLRALVSLRPAIELRLDSCLEFHALLAKVLSQLPELALPSPEARQLADAVLAEEVARLDRGARELLQPGRGLLLRGKLILVRDLVRSLDRLGLGLGANGRPGLISILLNRYLFPEALPLWQPDASHPGMEDALSHVAQEGGVRLEALQLVQFLMTGCPSNLEQGLRDLTRLHYDNGLRAIDKKFDITGDAVRLSDEAEYVGLRNGGATCYMNSVLQQLFMQPRIRELVLAARAVDPEEQQDSVFHQLQVMFAHLRLSRASCYHPRGFWHSFKDYDGQPIDVREHQDAYEFFTRLQDSVDSYLRATGQSPAMQAVMGGKFAAQIICKDINYRSEREEEFYQISVEVKGFHSLEKSLEGYVAGELMEGDNSYYCEELGARVAAVRRTVIKELPQTLVIHLKRFEYDHLNMTRYKLRDRFEFPVVLDMFKYTADGLAALEATGSGTIPGGAGAGCPSSGAAQGDGGGGSGAAGGAAGGDGGARPRNSYLYELKGIVVHSGTAFAGHYYSFIKERPRVCEDGQVTEGGWYRFDDKVVTPWSIQDLEADCFGGRPPGSNAGTSRADAERPYSAYMLFYERRDAASYDRPVAEMRAVPRDLVLASSVAAAAAAERTAAAATSRGAAAADDMETDVPEEQQQQERGTVGGAPEAVRMDDAPAITTPYGMPVLLYQNVLRENLQLMHKLHVLNKEYFAFVRQVVEVTWETVLAGRKTRRRDHTHYGASGAAGAGGSTGPVPMSPAATTTTAAAAGGGGTSGAASGGAESSSAPSQRNEELDETVLLSARLAAAFLLNVYIPAPPALRSDLAAWRDLLRHLLQASPRACVELLRLLTASPALINYYFVRANQQDGMWLSDMLAHALHVASRAAAHPAPAPPAPCASPGGGGGGGEDAAAALQGAAQALAAALCDLTFGVMHDTTRSEPQHVPLCRALAAVVSADAAAAWNVLNNHLIEAFALPGFLLQDLGAATDPELLPELSASLCLIHALMQYCFHHTQGPPSSAAAAAQQQQQHSYHGPVLRMPPTAASAGGAAPEAPRPQLYDITAQLDELVGLNDNGVFDAALAHSGLMRQQHVIELLHFLMAGNAHTSIRFLTSLFRRLNEAEASGVALLDALEGVPAALEVNDGLRLHRFFALFFGNSPSLRFSLNRMAQQALQRSQTLSWLGMAVAAAIGGAYTASDAGRQVVRTAASHAVAPLVSSVMVLIRQLTDFAQAQERNAAAVAAAAQQQQQGAGGGAQGQAQARDAAAATAALAARARKIGVQLGLLLQHCLPVIQAAQEQQQQHHQQQRQAAAQAARAQEQEQAAAAAAAVQAPPRVAAQAGPPREQELEVAEVEVEVEEEEERPVEGPMPAAAEEEEVGAGDDGEEAEAEGSVVEPGQVSDDGALDEQPRVRMYDDAAGLDADSTGASGGGAEDGNDVGLEEGEEVSGTADDLEAPE